MGLHRARRRRIPGFILMIAIATALCSPESAWAMKNRTIVLRAAGSGAVLGLGAGLVSYPFAKSTGTIIAGVVVGAMLGTVYGFHLVEVKEERARDLALEGLHEMNERRNAVLARGRTYRGEFYFPVSVLEF